MKPIRDRQVFSQRLHVTTCPVFITEGFRFFRLFHFVFHVGPSFDFKGNGSLVDCVSPVRSIGCLYCPPLVIHVGCDEGPFQNVFVSFPRCPFVAMASRQFFIQMTFDRRWSSILETCSAQRSCIWRSMASMLVSLAILSTSILVTKSLQCIFRMVRRQR